MNKETRWALEKSIKKWMQVVSGTGEDAGAHNCALCARFDVDVCETGAGERCPVRIVVRRLHCQRTPYIKWHSHIIKDAGGDRYAEFPYSIKKGCKECKKLATAELKFLISLRPKAGKIKRKAVDKK